MKLETLTSYGILPAFIERWRVSTGDRLLDWQADAVLHYGLLDAPEHTESRNNLLVVAPTSSGKTFIGELAAAAALSRRKKVIFVVPLKAIAGEKFETFQETFGALGFKAIISTRDHRQFDHLFLSGNFDIAIVVAEKLRHLLVQKIDLLERVALIVADEIHLLADPDRGPALLSVLEKLAQSDFDCRIIGLSTRLPAADFLAEFLNARIMRVCRRPVELRRGVLCAGSFRYREDNSGETGIEQLTEADNDDESSLRLINAQLEAGECILVFGKAKTDCHYRAARLAELRPERTELDDTARWVLNAGGPVVSGLAQWYAKGIGVHHADLSLAQRRLTEQLFRDGKLNILFCTGTLAMGVNLPASVVYVEAERFTGGRYGNAPFLTALEPHEFDNAAGRAGRLGLATTAGRAILCATTPIEADILWETYIAAPRDTGYGQLQWPGDQRRILEAAACGLVDDRFLMAEYFSQFDDRSGGKITDVGGHIERLAERDFLAVEDAGRLRATPAGLVAAASGVSPASVTMLRTLAAHYTSPDPVLWTAAVIAFPEGADLRWPRRFVGPFDPLGTAWREQFGDDFESTMARSFPDAFRPEVWYPKPHLRRRAMATALALGDWAKGDPAETLAAIHQAPLGRFEQVAETISWLIDTAATLAEADPQLRSTAPALWKTSFEIRRGLPFCFHNLAEALGGEIPREGILQLARMGWDKPETIARARTGDFAGVFPETIATDIIERVNTWIGQQPDRGKPVDDQPTTNREEKSSNKEAVMSGPLTLDGRSLRSRFAIELGECTCALRAKSFKYLFALAAARFMRDDGWIDKHDVEAGENQIKYFYQLRQELKAAYADAHRLIENDGSGRYRLALPPDMIRFNLDRIAGFPDIEIQQTAEKLSAVQVGIRAA